MSLAVMAMTPSRCGGSGGAGALAEFKDARKGMCRAFASCCRCVFLYIIGKVYVTKVIERVRSAETKTQPTLNQKSPYLKANKYVSLLIYRFSNGEKLSLLNYEERENRKFSKLLLCFIRNFVAKAFFC